MASDGTIYVVDRIKDMFISGGENVYPAEIEDVVASLDDVGLCAVIGVPDERWGEVGLALVVPRPGRTVDAAQVADFCRQRLARYKVPRRVDIVDALPLSPQGKVLKKELRRLYVEGGGARPPEIA
jgi:fatty-acyl-CoA synthase